MSAPPPITIGLPVYNGERYLAWALDALLAQDYVDFRLMISDNASEDATQEICREYAARDPRIEYFRQPENLGGVGNFNFLYGENQSPFYKWATYDDGHAESYLSRCMEAFEEAPASVVLVYPQVMLIGPEGEPKNAYDERLDLRHPDAPVRLGQLVRRIRKANALLGVIRADALASTKLYQRVTGFDNVLLAELALRGEFWELPERLFFRRIHPAASSQDDLAGKMAWLSAGRNRSARFALSRRVLAHFDAIGRAPLSPLGKARACFHYVPAHAHARIRHRRHQLAKLVRRNARRLLRPLRRSA